MKNKMSKKNKKDAFNILEVEIAEDVAYVPSKDTREIIDPNLIDTADKVNTRIKDKMIVNNKPSQFGPRINIDFHNIKL